MQAHLAGSPTYVYEAWKVTARDGAVSAYANCSRPITFGGTLYAATSNEPTRTTRRMGLSPDGAEMSGVYDDHITRADVQGGRWADARVFKCWVYYYDPDGYGALLPQKGFVGKTQPRTFDFTLEFRSLSSRLEMQIGKRTSPIDRRRRVDQLGIDPAPYIHVTSVTATTDGRKLFKVPFLAPSPDYFKYGVCTWGAGNNSGQIIEIKAGTVTDGGTLTEIELQYPTRAVIQPGDPVTLMRGYDGRLETAKALGTEVVVGMDAEVTMPLPDDVLRYQP
jgi:uncharacterized phage protein (TIGR02218 family)